MGTTATASAESLLKQVWADDLATCPIPVDPNYIAQMLGIKVYRATLDGDVSGMIVKRKGQDAEIYFNQSDHPNRQRFTTAHEIGHYIKNADLEHPDWEYVDRRDSMSGQAQDPNEIFANQFAAALLMPESRVRSLTDLPPATMAVKFGVSLEAMKFRLKNLGLSH